MASLKDLTWQAQIGLFTRFGLYNNKVYVLPEHLDERVARLHLDALGVRPPRLTPEQASCLGVSEEGPFKIE